MLLKRDISIRDREPLNLLNSLETGGVFLYPFL
jgi:hypothetical protein